MNIWQIATGESGRDYRDIFVDYDVMILGPSHKGSAKIESYHDGVANSSGSQVHNFAHSLKPGDRVLMRFGKEIIGVGEIPNLQETYDFNKKFGCVYGWDLCHSHRVTWGMNLDLDGLKNVYANAKQKPSFTQVHERHISSLVRSIPSSKFDRPLKDLPDIDCSFYSDEELGVELFRAGISNKNINDILVALQQAERLCSWYWSDQSGRYPTEFEIISHIIVPLLLGLGWSHQQIAVEWNRIDVALFKTTPTTKENCVLVIEAKGLGSALSNVLNQPIEYVRKLSLPNIRYILTTDGANIFMYYHNAGEWNSNPAGYINVNSLQKNYILPKGVSLVDTLVKLQPSMI